MSAGRRKARRPVEDLRWHLRRKFAHDPFVDENSLVYTLSATRQSVRSEAFKIRGR
jgi:hypothetical protein